MFVSDFGPPELVDALVIMAILASAFAFVVCPIIRLQQRSSFVSCPGCGRNASESATTCPRCGRPSNSPTL